MIRKLYHTLYAAFGPQGWWPTTPASSLTPVYHPKKPLHQNTEPEKFEICLGALLTQNTSWDNVVKVLAGLKRKKWLGFQALVKRSPRQLEPHLRSSGYFRQKSIRVANFLSLVHKESRGRLGDFLTGSLPRVRNKLLSIKGIGPETADSMLLYAQGHPIFVVDAYTRRIGTRWGVLKGAETYDEIQKVFMKALPRSAAVYGEAHALLVQLAKGHCRTQPLCDGCPVRSFCKTGQKTRRKT